MFPSQVHFGGPDQPGGRLRDLLAERVAAVPAGGSIDWVTYYFRDRRLAAELARARRRGVAVRVTLDGHPRTPRANDAVIGALAEDLGEGLRVVAHRLDAAPFGRFLRPRLHEKLYCFSGPRAAVFVGSFNPSGDEPELEPAVLREIGDQDRGHNALVELCEPALVAALVGHARRLHRGRHGPLTRFSLPANRALHDGELAVYFWPRVLPHPVASLLRRCAAGSRVRIAASHLSGPSSQRDLLALLGRGAALAVLAESTERRVPPAVEERLRAAGATFWRLGEARGLPMHDKFALIEAPGLRRVAFGSFNWTEPSRRFNREIGVVSQEAGLFQAFEARWVQLQAEAGG